MKIIQITPGVISIPPNGWGAVEKIIWEYKQSLDSIGYPTDILYTDDVKDSPNQIVHVHMANLANILHSRSIPYVFSLHDHHVEYYGKGSECYNQNYEAIKNSKLTFVHSKHLILYFDNLSNIVYLPHGANLTDYRFSDRSERVRLRPHKLVMMANNGVGGDNLKDRKGFLIGIESAKKLNLDISIICPSKGNKEFFDHHKPNYDKLTIHYDLDHTTAISLLEEHDIFLHPSNLEAGHPNLTLVESISMGIPVVGVLDADTELKGMIKVNISVDSFVSGISEAIDKYDSLVNLCYNYRDLNSWEIVVSRMLQEYKQSFNVSEKDQLIYNYVTTKKNPNEKLTNRGFVSNFRNYKSFIKNSVFSGGSTNIFSDKRTGRIIYTNSAQKNPSSWAYTQAPSNEFIDWLIEVKEGVNVIYKNELNLRGNRILLEVDNISTDIIELVQRFQDSTGGFVTIKSDRIGSVNNICFDKLADPEEFYFTLNELQMFDYFKTKSRLPEKILFEMGSSALGDTLGFIPYAQKWAELNDKTVDVILKFKQLFDDNDYPNLNIIGMDQNIDKRSYTNISKFEYLFDRPLQMGYSDQLGLKYEEIRPKVKIVNGERPVKSKYVCIGVHTTAQCKYWNNPDGWDILCKKLRKIGLTPISLDMNDVFGIDGMWNNVPNSCVKKLGMSLDDIILHLQYCEFFIGVSSGLSWLSWGVGKKVVMISGTTDPKNEFELDNIRIHNNKVCNSCFTKVNKYRFSSSDWMWCPELKNTDRQFECTKSITPDDVVNKMKESGLIF